MRFRPAGGLDLATVALILGGAGLLAASLVVGVMLLASPAPTASPSAGGEPAATVRPGGGPAVELPGERVATVLSVDTAAGAGAFAQIGDHVDVLGYFSAQATGSDGITRVLIEDVPVLDVDRTGGSVALTLQVAPDSALLLQESQALGARPFITLRSVQHTADLPTSFSDEDLASRVAGAN